MKLAIVMGGNMEKMKKAKMKALEDMAGESEYAMKEKEKSEGMVQMLVTPEEKQMIMSMREKEGMEESEDSDEEMES